MQWRLLLKIVVVSHGFEHYWDFINQALINMMALLWSCKKKDSNTGIEIGFDEIEFTKLILKKFDENDPYYTNDVSDGKDHPFYRIK